MKPLILVIEDDAQIRRFLRAALDAEGYRLQESVTAEEGLAQAQSRQPDLILLDLGLPDRWPGGDPERSRVGEDSHPGAFRARPGER